MAEGSPSTECIVRDRSWSTLPLLILEKICSLMDPKDKISMSKVCKTWNEGYDSASICENYKFALTDEDMLSANPWDKKELVDQKAAGFEKVVIGYCLITSKGEKIENWIKHFEVLLDILTRKSRLNEIHFLHLSILFNRVDNATYSNISRKIGLFMKSQDRLETVVFLDCLFKHDDGLKILKNTIQNNFNCLSLFILADFVKLMTEDDGREQIFLDFVRLPKLKHLSIDYKLMLGKYANPLEIKEAIKNFPKLECLQILLHVEEYTTSFQKLGESDWTDLNASKKKTLKIHNSVITKSLLRDQNEYIIVPGLPVTCIIFWFNRDTGDIGPFFAHALSCKANQHLLQLILHAEASIPDVASGLVPFLDAAQRLEILLFNLVYPVDGLDVLLETLSKIRTAYLESFHLNINRIGSEDNKSKLIELLSNYVDYLKIKANLCL